ncbi:MAG: hypothetical protein JO360_17310 [Acidobacteria bacterium]|nr:hypothetical protein [Acidobacteriota bacterium]
MKAKLFPLAGVVCLLLLCWLPGTFQTLEARPARDHLTPQEADLVREAQELDKRTEVFIKAAERRLLALSDPNAAQKEKEKWGELKGTRADFLYDLSRILDEAITNIDDVSSRDESNPLIPKSIRKLAEASTRILTQLEPLRGKLESDKELHSLDQAIENAQDIVEAAGKLPPPPSKTEKKKKESSQD